MWTSMLASFFGAAVAMGLGISWRSYFSEKGKNLATKQDIGAITEKIEEVRIEYARGLEAAKVAWAAHSSLFTYRYQREYDVLRTLAKRLFEVKIRAEFFAKYPPPYPPSDSTTAAREERGSELKKALRELVIFKEELRPFYPEHIYDSINRIVTAGSNEVNFFMGEGYGLSRGDYGDEAVKNATALEKSAIEAIDAIRLRINEWERFSVPD